MLDQRESFLLTAGYPANRGPNFGFGKVYKWALLMGLFNLGMELDLRGPRCHLLPYTGLLVQWKGPGQNQVGSLRLPPLPAGGVLALLGPQACRAR